MKKTVYIYFLILTSTAVFSQVGINTSLPSALFHVDGKNDNSKTSPATPAQLLNDAVISSEGNIGIGTITPTNKLEVRNDGKTNTGLILTPNSVSKDMVLVSDKDGNANWGLAERKARTSIYSATGTAPLIGSMTNMAKYTTLTDVKMDEAKSVFGNQYGWDIINQQYIAPIKGMYRISLTFYFEPGTTTDYYKLGMSKGVGSKVLMNNYPYIAILSEAKKKLGFVTGLVILEKGDVLEVKGANEGNPTLPIKVMGGQDYSTLLIELVKQIR